ncbi:unnamed protein product [Acanthosepion pharaonis]|uniref:Uncharacterized protein n=1 Tax=Acanthosepion pharaonis TaxID=158019 RepID=A0A812CVF0_ACAPH|nr:unnamed protein product [Sepia pharaonis]
MHLLLLSSLFISPPTFFPCSHLSPSFMLCLVSLILLLYFFSFTHIMDPIFLLVVYRVLIFFPFCLFKRFLRFPDLSLIPFVFVLPSSHHNNSFPLFPSNLYYQVYYPPHFLNFSILFSALLSITHFIILPPFLNIFILFTPCHFTINFMIFPPFIKFSFPSSFYYEFYYPLSHFKYFYSLHSSSFHHHFYYSHSIFKYFYSFHSSSFHHQFHYPPSLFKYYYSLLFLVLTEFLIQNFTNHNQFFL